MAVDDLERALQDVLAGYPEPVVRRERERAQCGRYLHELRMMHSPRGRIVDLGGGVAATSAALGRLGCEAYVVDSFNRPYYASTEFARARAYLEDCGTRIVDADLLGTQLDFLEDGSVDCIASFDCVEHLHHSPAGLFALAMRKLRPGGRFVIGVPNAVNLAKRARVLRGRTNFSSFDEFYRRGQPFTGHVREYTADELRQIGALLGLSHVRIEGRNWLGYEKGRRFPMPLLRAVDSMLRLRPQLCSDLYLSGAAP